MMELVDTHCHLTSNRLVEQYESFVTMAQEAAVQKMITVGCDYESSLAACHQAAAHDALFASVGIQPHDANQYTPEEAERVVNLARTNKKVVAIGEIGLEGFYKGVPMEMQITCFRHLLALATSMQLPVIVHMRDTFADIKTSLDPFCQKGLQGVIHCFTGTLDEARYFLDRGFYISFSGIVTFKNSVALQEVAKFVPSDRILLETDSPYLAPIPHRGALNHPALMVHTAVLMATLRGVSLETIAEQTTANAQRLFRGLTRDA
jgi:TatD DNase family protein